MHYLDENDSGASCVQPLKPESCGNKNRVRISNFFRPISKSDFIKDSEKRTLTVKAMVHSPSEIRSALKPESEEPLTTSTPKATSSKKRRSKYV